MRSILNGYLLLMNTPPTYLVEAITARACLLFLGPDISESAGGYRGVPTSWQLTDELAQASGYRGQYQPLPRMAQIYARQFGDQALVRFLIDRLDRHKFRPLPIHELIARLPFRLIINAGWDVLLEQALDNRGVRYEVIYNAQDIGYLKDEKLTVFRPYGSIERPGSMIITDAQLDQLLGQGSVFLGALGYHLNTHTLLLAGHSLDYDRVFTQLYYRSRREQQFHRPPVFVVQSTQRPDDRVFWESLDIEFLSVEPGQFFYDLVRRLAATSDQFGDLPAIDNLSSASRSTATDLQEHIALMNRAMASLGIAELIERTDVPVLSREQVRNLEALRSAYERLAAGQETTPESASVWLRQGNLEYARENYNTAIGFYQRVIATGEKTAEAYHNLHFLYLAQHSDLLNMGQFTTAKSKLEEAWSAYEQAVKLDPTLAVVPSRYRLTGLLGQGGVGIVYRAVDTQSGESVAIKMLRRASAHNEKAIARFEREADILRQLTNPHFVRVLDVSQFDGRGYIVLEDLGDLSIERRLEEGRPIGLAEAVKIVGQTGRALQVAHNQQVIHRDIKPSNIFWVDNQIKIIDFGLATTLVPGEVSIVGPAGGSVRYMAPEQRLGQAADASVDQYALATVFYEMISRRRPDEGAYLPLSQLVTGINPALDLVVDKARSLSPTDRYTTISDFVDELGRVAVVQPAYGDAAGWLKLVHQIQKGLGWAFEQRWYVTVAAALLVGVILPEVSPLADLKLAARFVGLLIWVGLLAGTLHRLFVNNLARSHGAATLAAFEPLMGFLVGLGAVLTVWIPEILHITYLDDSHIDWASYAGYWLLFGGVGLGLTLLAVMFLRTGLSLGKRRGWSGQQGIVVGYAAIAALFLAFGWLLNLLNT
ncbi:MAG: protein kinase [Chloroflexi bacterium]|nr:protein kinase [Chloroflexota bacterium]